MNKKQYDLFMELRDKFRQYTQSITGLESDIIPVYNKDLDSFTESSRIKYILLADNPGREEAVEHRYLIGHAGKQARNFFEGNQLVSRFSDEVMVLNKTCIHTVSTGDLKQFKKSEIFTQSQKFMAETAFGFHRILNCEMWIVGCSEFRNRGIFSQFKDAIAECYAKENSSLKDKVFCYKHFSYGNFSHDLKIHPSADLNIKLHDIGTEMRNRFLGW